MDRRKVKDPKLPKTAPAATSAAAAATSSPPATVVPPAAASSSPAAASSSPAAATSSPAEEEFPKRRPGRPCKLQRPAPLVREGVVAAPATPGALMELTTGAHKCLKRALDAFKAHDSLLLAVDAAGLSILPEDAKLLARFQGRNLTRFYAAPGGFVGRVRAEKLMHVLSGLDAGDHSITLTLLPPRDDAGAALRVDVVASARRNQSFVGVEPLDLKGLGLTPEQCTWAVPPPNAPPSLSAGGLQFDLTFRMPAIELKKIYAKFSPITKTMQLTFQDDCVVFQHDDNVREFVDRQHVRLTLDRGISDLDLQCTVISIDLGMLKGLVASNKADEEVVVVSATRSGRRLIEKVDQTGGFALRLLV